jgi:hypothetical protein
MARSPNYPSISLPEAIALTKKIFDAERQALMTHEVAAGAMGYTALHGPARRKVAALRKYGLLDASGTNVRVSSHAMAILHPKTDAEKAAAIRNAALRPELYQELAAETGASDANLKATLIRRGFLPDSAAKAVASFRASMSLVTSESAGYDDADEEESGVIESPEVKSSQVRNRGMAGLAQSLPPQTTSAEFAWLLPKGVQVEVRFRGGPFTKDGLRVLRRYLDVVEMAIEEEPLTSVPIEPPPPSERSPADAQD